jgi:membrane associated rhomboid family serine protease
MNRIAVRPILSLIKPVIVKVVSGMLEFKGILLWYLVILLVSSSVFITSLAFPQVSTALAASRNTFWGVFTSIFVHNSWQHLLLNMVGLFLFVIFFTSANSTLSTRSKKEFQIFFLISALGLAVVSNFLWIAFNTGSSVGASGLVYGVMGIVTSSCILNGLQALGRKHLRKQSTQTMGIVLMNIVLGISLVFEVFQNPQVFLNISEGVNIIVHGVSFVLGLSFILPWHLIMDVSVLE